MLVGGFLFPFVKSCPLSWDFRCSRAAMPTGACKNKPTNPILKHIDYFVGFMVSSVPDSCQVILADSLPRAGFLKTCNNNKMYKSPLRH